MAEAHSLLHAARRYWLLIVAIALFGALLGGLRAGLSGPTYESSSTVLFSNDPVARLAGLADEFDSLGDPTLGGSTMQTRLQLIEQRPVAAAVRRQLGTGRSVSDLLDHVRSEQEATSSLARIVVDDDDAKEATRIANTWARVFAHQENARHAAQLNAAIKLLAEEETASTTRKARRRVVRDVLTRLETLRGARLQSVRVVGVARVPTQPEGAGWAVGAMAGLLIGLVAGFGAALVLARVRRP
jgi:capsular polysaccharide biosynthesis protein